MLDISKCTGEDKEIVEYMEKQFPEMTNEFKNVVLEQYVLFCKKQHLYGSDNISQGTNLQTQKNVDFSLMGIFFRVNDKIQRIKQMIFYNVKDTVGEDLEETFGDMSNYGIISRIILRGKWAK